MKNRPVDLQQEFLSALYELGQAPCTLDQIRRIRPNLPEIEVVQCHVPSAYYTINYYDRPRTYCITPEGVERLNERRRANYNDFVSTAAAIISLISLLIAIFFH